MQVKIDEDPEKAAATRASEERYRQKGRIPSRGPPS